MSESNLTAPISRRRALALGGGIAAGGIVSSVGAFAGTAAARSGHEPRNRGSHHGRHQHGALPADQIQHIVQAQGTVTKGVLSIDIERKDIGEVSGPLGVTFTPAFEIDGTLTFQPIEHGAAFFNGDLALKPEETQDGSMRSSPIVSSSKHFTSTTSRLIRTSGSSTSEERATR